LPLASKRAFLLALCVTGLNALVFWSVSGVFGSPAFLSFWNRALSERVLYTALYVLISARLLIWFHDRLERYAQGRKRGTLRRLPLAFGVAVFASTLAWWSTVVVAVPAVELHGILFRQAQAEWTLVLLPFSYFLQLLFVSPSTVLWFLLAGVSWPLVSVLPVTGRVLSGFYSRPASLRPSQPLWLLKIWNVFGYLMFFLSLLFQSR
jgi:hypothetical protein